MEPAQGAPRVVARLQWQAASGEERELRLQEGDTVSLGRQLGNDLVLASKRVSRRHAVIKWRGDRFYVSDLGSTNGTRVNEERIDRPRQLQDGDRIRMSDMEIHFREIEDEEEAPAPGRQTLIVASGAPQPRLIVTSGPEEGREIPLHGDDLTIGRDTARDNWDIPLQDRAISRPHARLERSGDGYTITDLGSANGTLVNGDPIAEPTPLDDGDVVLLGEATILYRVR